MRIDKTFQTSFWPIMAAIAALSALGIAHAFETFGGLMPCALCLRQREVYWLALTIAIIGLAVMRAQPGWRAERGVVALLGLTFLTGAIVAGYHAGVEWHFWPGPSTCTGGGDALAGLSIADLGAALGKAGIPPACDQIPWSFAGISMAGWNMVLSLMLAGASFYSLTQAKEPEIAP